VTEHKKDFMPKFVGFPIAKKELVEAGYFVACLMVNCGGCGDKHPWNVTLSKN
jgi:hypothetical protein